jgi:hypothetical protein
MTLDELEEFVQVAIGAEMPAEAVVEVTTTWQTSICELETPGPVSASQRPWNWRSAQSPSSVGAGIWSMAGL